MPLISVIVPTLRVGGLDVLFDGLARQTFKDFELILVDSIIQHRRDLVAEIVASRKYPFPVKHVPPWHNPFPRNTYQRSVNSGVMHASAPVCYFTCDYAWLAPDCLARHAGFYYSRGIGREAVLGPMHIHRTPELAQEFPSEKYGLSNLGDMMSDEGKKNTMALWDVDGVRHDAVKRWVSSYVSDLEAGRLRPFMWTIFEKELRADPRQLPVIHVEEKASKPAGPIHHYFCHLKNDSIPTQALLDINGFDEDFDDCHGWQDSEVADRLTNRLGMQFHVVPESLVHLLDVHHLMIIRQILRPEKSNEALMFTKRSNRYADPTNTAFDLADLRRKALSV